ncbi:MAG TPA: hypothetical protein VJ992_12890 [Gemmatimonadales bacterium]|nr:hypothetical protein [Gemmatimonadales bacterium]
MRRTVLSLIRLTCAAVVLTTMLSVPARAETAGAPDIVSAYCAATCGILTTTTCMPKYKDVESCAAYYLGCYLSCALF